MLPIERLRPEEARALRGLLFDLDDTFLDRGRLDERAYASLFRLVESGLGLIVVTGRPAGWGEVLARQWPVLGVVTENGAVAFARDERGVRRFDTANPEQRAQRAARLQAIVRQLQSDFPELTPADDVSARLSDFTFDIGEHRQVAPEVVARAEQTIRAAGARSTHSSVHLHVSLDSDDKASGTLRLLAALERTDATLARITWAFIGDSENDAACFAAFRTTLGVANLSGRPTLRPRFITRGARSAGFVEAAEHLLRLRG